MPTFIPVAKLGDVPPGKIKTFQVNNRRILIANVAGTLFATQDVCTHDNGPLGDGELFGEEVECPRHGARFNVKTGKATQMPAIFPIKTFPVQVDGDDILIAFG